MITILKRPPVNKWQHVILHPKAYRVVKTIKNKEHNNNNNNNKMNLFKGVREYFTPILKESQLSEKGVLTPKEFEQSGDEIAEFYGTWKWEKGNKIYKKSYLDDDKQYLITKGVPSFMRASELLNKYNEKVVEGKDDDDDDGWVSTYTDEKDDNKEDDVKNVKNVKNNKKDDDIEEIGGDDDIEEIGGNDDDNNHDDDNDDMDDLVEDDLEEIDESLIDKKNVLTGDDLDILKGGDNGIIRVSEPEEYDEKTVQRTRRYDISITYDKVWQTPHIYLFGYDEDGQPLTSKQMLEDISGDHANKTVTMEPHPHTGIIHASIHPCKHANVMKKFIGMLDEDVEKEDVFAKMTKEEVEKYQKEKRKKAIDQYLPVFLKFMSCIIPTINYDFTRSAF